MLFLWLLQIAIYLSFWTSTWYETKLYGLFWKSTFSLYLQTYSWLLPAVELCMFHISHFSDHIQHFWEILPNLLNRSHTSHISMLWDRLRYMCKTALKKIVSLWLFLMLLRCTALRLDKRERTGRFCVRLQLGSGPVWNQKIHLLHFFLYMQARFMIICWKRHLLSDFVKISDLWFIPTLLRVYGPARSKRSAIPFLMWRWTNELAIFV